MGWKAHLTLTGRLARWWLLLMAKLLSSPLGNCWVFMSTCAAMDVYWRPPGLWKPEEASKSTASVLDRNLDAETRVAGSIEFYLTAQDFRGHLFRFLCPRFAGASQADEACSIPRKWYFGFCWSTQWFVCTTPVVYRIPQTSQFSLTLCCIDQRVLLPKQPTHFILSGLYRGQGLEKRKIRPFLPSLNKTGTVFLLWNPKCSIFIHESVFLKTKRRVRNV